MQRADRPLQILHADSTVFRTADQQKNYIHLVQDNYSRAILGFVVSKECSARNMFATLSGVIRDHLVPAGVESCTLLTDDGSENAGEVALLVKVSVNPSIDHLIAQRDISYSNSMIEAANKHLKYRFLYRQHIADYKALVAYVMVAIKDYNNRPHHVLNGLTPLEVLYGVVFDRDFISSQIAAAKAARTAANKKTRCCLAGF